MKIKFNKLKLQITIDNKSSPTIVKEFQFSNGINLILSNENSAGKSCIINSLIYSLGLMDNISISALTAEELTLHNGNYAVIKSEIWLEIENEENKIITIYRVPRSDNQNQNSKIAVVYEDNLENYDKNNNRRVLQHKNKGYSNPDGFHRYLCKFIGYHTPDTEEKFEQDYLYLEYITSAIFVEQQRGWSGIMANKPNYITNGVSITISEILGLNSFDLYKREQMIKRDINENNIEFKTNYKIANDLASNQSLAIHGKTDIINNFKEFKLFKNDVALEYLIDNLYEEIKKIKHEMKIPNEAFEFMPEITSKLDEANSFLQTIDSEIKANKNLKKQKENLLITLKDSVNKFDLDINRFTQEERLLTYFGKSRDKRLDCPVCQQEINQLLVKQDKLDNFKSIEENVNFLKKQKNLINEIIVHNEILIKEYEIVINSKMSERIKILNLKRTIYDSLKKYMRPDLNILAQQLAENEINRHKLNDLNITIQSINKKCLELKEQFSALELQKQSIKSEKENLNIQSTDLVKKFENKFKSYLSFFGYNSIPISDDIIIKLDKYLPQYRRGDIYDHSASDNIRLIWAYTLALMSCKDNSEYSKHLGFTILDGIGNQEVEKESQKLLFDLVARKAFNGQIFLSALDDTDELDKYARKYNNINIINLGDERLFH